MKFDIRKRNKKVASFENGVVSTTDPKILGWIRHGVLGLVGGNTRVGQEDGFELFKPTDSGFFGRFVDALLENGYDVPIWVTDFLLEEKR